MYTLKNDEGHTAEFSNAVSAIIFLERLEEIGDISNHTITGEDNETITINKTGEQK